MSFITQETSSATRKEWNPRYGLFTTEDAEDTENIDILAFSSATLCALCGSASFSWTAVNFCRDFLFLILSSCIFV